MESPFQSMQCEMSSGFGKRTNIKELTPSEIEEITNLRNKDGHNILTILRKCFGIKYNKNNKYLISIQGSSSSGKSTLAHSIFNILMANGVECLLLELDRYYKSTENNIQGYDFDNPASLDWEKIRNVLKAVDNDEPLLPLYEYSFITKLSSGPFMATNNHPRVVIVEGIYAFNCMSDKMFNINEFDPTDSHKCIDNEFIVNDNLNKFKILNVRLTLCKNKSLEVRTGRDVIQRNKSKEEAVNQFHEQVWPATQKWVNSCQFEEDIRIIHGSFNENKVKLFVGCVSFFFTTRMISFKNIGCDLNLRHMFNIKCSKECREIIGSKIVLDDDE